MITQKKPKSGSLRSLILAAILLAGASPLYAQSDDELEAPADVVIPAQVEPQTPPPPAEEAETPPAASAPPADQTDHSREGGREESAPAPAGEPADDSGEASDDEASPEEEPEAVSPRADPCRVLRTEDEERLDQYRREIFETVCETAARFDSFFGNLRFDEEARRTHGRAALRLIWDEHEGFELDGDLKVKVEFPNLDHRVNAFLGREERDDFVAGAEDELDFLPTFFEREGGEEWLLGLGYRPVSGDRSSVDVDAGIEADTPLDPFVRARGRYFWLLGDDNLLRARQTLYWTNQKGFGTGTRLDFERPLGERTLARWTGNIVFDDETEGGDWNTGITLYHGFSPNRAVSWFVGVDGESGREVPIEDYGTRVTYRQRMLRDWFFGEVVTGVTWPRDNLEEERELAFHVGFGFEIQFSGEDLRPGSE